VTLYADSLHTVYPAYAVDTYKVVGLVMYANIRRDLAIITLKLPVHSD
jgi:hypothetical protein